MGDAADPSDLSDALEKEQAAVMQRIYRRLALDRGLGPFGELDGPSRDYLLSEAHQMCRNWEIDAALRELHVAGKSEIVDLVAYHYRLVEHIHSAENRAIAQDGAADQTKH